MSISDQELEKLCTKLADLELSDDQRLLLDSILKIVWDFVSSPGDLNAAFAGSFAPEEAEMIMAYPSATPTSSITRSITGGPGTHSITRAV